MKKLILIFAIAVIVSVIHSCTKDSNADNSTSIVDKVYGYVEKHQRIKSNITYLNGEEYIKQEYEYDDQGRLVYSKVYMSGEYTGYYEYIFNGKEIETYVTDYGSTPEPRQLYSKSIYY